MADQMTLQVNGNDNMHAARDVKRQDFPQNFMFGVGTSAYQVEGAWNKDGKGLSIWDCFTQRHPDKIKGGANACVTVDNYSRFKEDVQLLKKMGVTSYRFSIAWSRILPGGKVSMGTSREGIDHYNKLIDELLANGIEPFVTLFHYDLPNALEEEYMGFLSSKNIVNDFVNYANICFWEFGDRVKNWATLNEPHIFAYTGYTLGVAAPGRGGKGEDGDPQLEPYLIAYNLLNCHAAVYRIYQEDYKASQKGKVGITLDCTYYQPYDASQGSDLKAVDYAYDFTFGWFMEPLTKGSWPESMQTFATEATPENPNGRTLPQFSKDQQKSLIGSYDFLGINYYTANFVQYQDPSDKVPLGYETDCHYIIQDKDSNDRFIGEPAYEGASVYLCPNQLRDLLVLIKNKYNITKEIIITENGSPDANDLGKTYDQVCKDTFRLNFLKQHLNAIKEARSKKVNVMGYFVWTFMDSYEWVDGYTLRYGMIYVDFARNLQRYPKISAVWYKKFLTEGRRLFLKRNSTEQENDVIESPNKTNQAIEATKKLKKSIN